MSLYKILQTEDGKPFSQIKNGENLDFYQTRDHFPKSEYGQVHTTEMVLTMHTGQISY